MYFKKISPSTTCLYSAASMLLRSLSAASQSVASNPRLAPLPLDFFARFFFATAFGPSLFVVAVFVAFCRVVTFAVPFEAECSGH